MSNKEGTMSDRRDHKVESIKPAVSAGATASGAWSVDLGFATGQIADVAEAFGDARSLTAAAYSPDAKTRASD